MCIRLGLITFSLGKLEIYIEAEVIEDAKFDFWIMQILLILMCEYVQDQDMDNISEMA